MDESKQGDMGGYFGALTPGPSPTKGRGGILSLHSVGFSPTRGEGIRRCEYPKDNYPASLPRGERGVKLTAECSSARGKEWDIRTVSRGSSLTRGEG